MGFRGKDEYAAWARERMQDKRTAAERYRDTLLGEEVLDAEREERLIKLLHVARPTNVVLHKEEQERVTWEDRGWQCQYLSPPRDYRLFWCGFSGVHEDGSKEQGYKRLDQLLDAICCHAERVERMKTWERLCVAYEAGAPCDPASLPPMKDRHSAGDASQALVTVCRLLLDAVRRGLQLDVYYGPSPEGACVTVSGEEERLRVHLDGESGLDLSVDEVTYEEEDPRKWELFVKEFIKRHQTTRLRALTLDPCALEALQSVSQSKA